jgi:TetR/AcrR family transcriptional repressor of nem operon
MNQGYVEKSGTVTQILDVAERLVEVRGFNGFSYADVAHELRITSAALHYHFASKSDLGVALITRYSSRFADALAAVEERTTEAPVRLAAYVELYLEVLRKQRMCLCGMMAAEHETLPKPMQDAVVRFFAENHSWLSRVLEQGMEEGTVEFTGSSDEAARLIVSSLEGAMLLARLFEDIQSFQSSASHLLAGFRPGPLKAIPTPEQSVVAAKSRSKG